MKHTPGSKARIITALCTLFLFMTLEVPMVGQYSSSNRRGRYSPRRSSRRNRRQNPRYRRSGPTQGRGKMRSLKQVWSKNFLKGYKITATFNRTDIRNVLRIFYEQTGLNFVITEEARGTVTGRFNNVSALEALITVLRVNDLYFIEEGSIIRIVPPDEYREDIIKKNLVTRVFDINHAQMKTLKEALEPVLTEGVGKAVLDEKTNKLLITDLKDNFKDITMVIDQFSKPGRQVYIDVKVVSISLDDGFEHGVNWSALNIGNYFSFNALFTPSSDLSRYGEFRMNRATSADGIGGEGFLKVLNSFTSIKLLSSPKIVAAHGEKAKIHIGNNIPYISKISQNQQTAISESTVSFIDDGIKVELTPYVGKDDTIKLQFKVEISEAAQVNISDTQKAPQKTSTMAESYILCDNGALVVIGGLFEHKKTKTDYKVPLLGSIPVVNLLFSWKAETVNKREIAIMIQPRLIDSKSTSLKKELKKVIQAEK